MWGGRAATTGHRKGDQGTKNQPREAKLHSVSGQHDTQRWLFLTPRLSRSFMVLGPLGVVISHSHSGRARILLEGKTKSRTSGQTMRKTDRKSGLGRER